MSILKVRKQQFLAIPCCNLRSCAMSNRDGAARSRPRLLLSRPSKSVLPAATRANSRRSHVRKKSRHHEPGRDSSVVPSMMIMAAATAMSSSSTPVPVAESIPIPAPTATIEPLSKAEDRRARKLGRAKMRRDRIVQEINMAGAHKKELQQMLTQINQRISELGNTVRCPTAKQVNIIWVS